MTFFILALKISRELVDQIKSYKILYMLYTKPDQNKIILDDFKGGEGNTIIPK